jgi:glucose/arabinose dehydrogenase
LRLYQRLKFGSARFVEKGQIMLRSLLALCAAAFASLAFGASPALRTEIVASGLSRPLFVAAPEGDSRLFVVRKRGFIDVIENGTVVTTPFLDLSASVQDTGERGLLGLAFDPGYATNRRFYVNYIDKTTLNTVVATYQAQVGQPNLADLATRQTVLTVPQTSSVFHKAGWMGFRPGEPSNLYIATGDGAATANGQQLNSNLGKILRVDVSEDRFPGDPEQYGYAIPAGNLTGGNPEIYAYGLRNPWRNSFDRETGTFYIADVGQTEREEINIGAAGANYGWGVYEGNILHRPDLLPISNYTPPIYEESHARGDVSSITGGYVYRGSEIEGLEGTYFFADFNTGRVTSFRYSEATGVIELTDRTGELISATGFHGQIASFGEDGFGNLYLVDFENGLIGMITAVPEPDTWAVMLAGIALIGGWVRLRARHARLV